MRVTVKITTCDTRGCGNATIGSTTQVREEGWSCSRVGDYCPECQARWAGQSVAETIREAAQ
jgi:hypothetical protein